jgi:hypothetical protein
MTFGELMQKKEHLENILRLLEEYDYDSVCQELGEIQFLIGKEDKKYGQSSHSRLQGRPSSREADGAAHQDSGNT